MWKPKFCLLLCSAGVKLYCHVSTSYFNLMASWMEKVRLRKQNSIT